VVKQIETAPDKAELYAKAAGLYVDLKSEKEAIQYYKKYIEMKPDDDKAHLEFALVLKNAGNMFNALRHLKICINLTKDKQLKKKAEEYIAQIEV